MGSENKGEDTGGGGDVLGVLEENVKRDLGKDVVQMLGSHA